jgi:hypothetical protein
MVDSVETMDETAQQSVHDHSLIEHLVATFHAEASPTEPMRDRTPALYDQIRREWPADLALGTRR